MEYPSAKTTKTISNISEIVSKFANVCKLRSIGVFHSENPSCQHPYKPISKCVEDISETTDETECNGEKIHRRPLEVSSKSNVSGYMEIMKIFEVVSALKLAYLKLQEAHVPYVPDKIIVADEQVVTELEKLCKFKRVYKEKRSLKAQLCAAHSELLRVEIEAKETLLGKLKSQNRAKDSEALRLQQELQDLELGNRKLAEKIKQITLEKRKASLLSITAFQDVFKAASKSIHDFAKPLINLMKASDWNLDLVTESIVDAVVYTKRSDKKYAFEAYIARRMFHGISLKSYNVDHIMRFDDPIDALIEYPDSEFAKFCGKKYLLVVHPTMEASFFGNLDHRTFILSGKHPRTPFYQLFARMARWIWVLQGIAVSLDPNATFFTVKSGSLYSNLYMESVWEEKKGAFLSDEKRGTHKVQFMVTPGFRIGQTLLKSRVYLSEFPTC
ncbi:IRK-interacting protein [Quillaja saponaria]|uniref:IRK-interacting protein n=1 Tax=Quillaja saponaria TaxID=32244 RepID=A0AAD7LUI5_QUISA|nr:IRK-interacting protein [Quillaja saponaria]